MKCDEANDLEVKLIAFVVQIQRQVGLQHSMDDETQDTIATNANMLVKLGDFGLAIEINEPIQQKCGSPV